MLITRKEVKQEIRQHVIVNRYSYLPLPETHYGISHYMRQELKNIFGKVFITITVDPENRWVHTNWAGYLTQDNIKAGALAYTNAIKESGFRCVLNDTREVLGTWDHSLDWVINEWTPQAASAGIRHFALITSPESFAESTASNFHANNKEFEVRVFDDMKNAQVWLKQYSSTN